VARLHADGSGNRSVILWARRPLAKRWGRPTPPPCPRRRPLPRRPVTIGTLYQPCAFRYGQPSGSRWRAARSRCSSLGDGAALRDRFRRPAVPWCTGGLARAACPLCPGQARASHHHRLPLATPGRTLSRSPPIQRAASRYPSKARSGHGRPLSPSRSAVLLSARGAHTTDHLGRRGAGGRRDGSKGALAASFETSRPGSAAMPSPFQRRLSPGPLAPPKAMGSAPPRLACFQAGRFLATPYTENRP
jgi:hypothetical protein